jgi:hypothetical protein
MYLDQRRLHLSQNKSFSNSEVAAMIEGLVQHDTEMRNADDRALTPLFHGHINPYGQFAIDFAQPSFLDAV